MRTESIFLSYLTIFLPFLMCLFSSCQNDCSDISDLAGTSIRIEYKALEKDLKDAESVDSILKMLKDNRTMSDYFLHAQQYPSDSILAKRLFRLSKDSYMDTLFAETLHKFSDMKDVLSDFELGFRRIKSHYPDTKVPKLQSIVTGFYNDLYISDSLIILGLDYFIGKEGSYKPNDIPNYILNRYERENLVPIVFSFISNNYNKSDLKHNTLLAEMINLGKSYYFVSQILPCTQDNLIIGFLPEEMELVKENQEVIWANLIENEMLYETDNFLKNKFVGERPNVPEINEKCPGRVGAWVGWEIVKAYMETNPSIELSELMADDDAHNIFQKARYRPKNLK